MPPVGNTVGFVNDEHAYVFGHVGEHVLAKGVICQALGRNQQDIYYVVLQFLLDTLPIVRVGAVDCLGAHSDATGGFELVAHESKQRRDQQADPGSRIAQEARGQEVDHALAPARALHDKQSPTVQQGFDALPLSVAKLRVGLIQCRAQIL